MADDQQPPAQRYWFPYWTSPPQPPPPPPAHRPAPRPQLSRRHSRPAPPQSPSVASSPSRRPPQPTSTTTASRGAGAASPQAQPQPTRLSSRPSPSRAPPLSPIREPNASAAPAPAPAPIDKEPKPPLKPAATTPTAHEAPKQKDIIIPQEKTIHERAEDSKTHSKAIENEKEKGKEKKKEKDKDKEKGKEKEIKIKEVVVSRHDEGDESKPMEVVEESAKKKVSSHGSGEHGAKLHKELKAGVADMVQKLSASAPSSGGHERPAAAAGATVITLAGENNGASMKIDSAADGKDAAGKERRGHRLDAAERKEAAGAKGLTAFVNSNVQVINNSLLLQSSCSGGNPGVHLKLTTKSKKKDAGDEPRGKGKK